MTDVDLIVIGTGGAGLTSAIVAHDLGAEVVVLEQGSQVGGTYGYSAGLVWAPNNRHMRAAGISDSVEEAHTHIRELSGGKHDERVLESFLTNVSTVVDYLEDKAGVPFEMVASYPDYYSERTGGKRSGRHLGSPVFRAGDELDEHWRQHLVVSPHFSAVPFSWVEIGEWGGFNAVADWDWSLRDERVAHDTRAFGPAAIGYMLKSVLSRDIPILLETTALELLRGSKGRVSGVRIRDAQGERSIKARRGVVLATGGYERNDALQHRWASHPKAIALGASTVDGSGLIMALEVGAAFASIEGEALVLTYHIPGEKRGADPLYRLFTREPALPGSVIVNRRGRRFADDSFFRSVCGAMSVFDASDQEFPHFPAYFVFDDAWKKTYALGSVQPGVVPDWLASGETPAQLATKVGIDADGLAASIESFNHAASSGVDHEFGRGAKYFSRNNGDPSVVPNPCLRPLEGMLYAIEIRQGSVGSTDGLVAGPDGEVIGLHGFPIAGLYAAGNVAANLVEGLWANSGVENARSLTFGYLSARHALAGRTRSKA
jgi:3-oxosteroid 1-dehydrogenase